MLNIILSASLFAVCLLLLGANFRDVKKRTEKMADNFYGITDTGKMRDNNEDNFIAQNILNGKYIAGCAIDGVGGYEGGEIAAALARAAILNTIKKTSGDIIEVLKTALMAANQKINTEKLSSGENMEMACVLTLALTDITNNKFYYAHVGDTRLYLFRDNSLVKVSHDHSFVGFLEDSGRITEDAAMQHPKRNEINKALGFNDDKFSEADYIETGESPFLPGDMLLLCSDGLSDMLNSKTITEILTSSKTIKEKSKALIDAANVAGGKDNITVVLIQNNKQPQQFEATKPVSIKKNEQEKEEIIQANNVVENKSYKKQKKKSSSVFFPVVCLVLFAVLAWFIYKDYFKTKQPKAVMPALVRKDNLQQQKLADTINNASSKEIELKNLFNQSSIFLTDTLFIQKDSLYINGNGLSLIADSSYNNVAIVLLPNCKYIFLDSITFENFDVGIITQNNALHLQNIQFKNCRVPVSYQMEIPNEKTVSGRVPDSISIKADSAKTRTNTK